MKKTIVMQFECENKDQFIDAFAQAVGHILSSKCAVKAENANGTAKYSMATIEYGEMLMFTQADIVADVIGDVQKEIGDALDNKRIVPDELIEQVVKVVKEGMADKLAAAAIAKASKTIQ